MNPMELGMYHQIENVIRVNPSFYEYLLIVDSDTTVERWPFVGKPFDLSVYIFFSWAFYYLFD